MFSVSLLVCAIAASSLNGVLGKPAVRPHYPDVYNATFIVSGTTLPIANGTHVNLAVFYNASIVTLGDGTIQGNDGQSSSWSVSVGCLPFSFMKVFCSNHSYAERRTDHLYVGSTNGHMHARLLQRSVLQRLTAYCVCQRRHARHALVVRRQARRAAAACRGAGQRDVLSARAKREL